ncbi:MAG: CRISPR-associated CARF protein Csa3 [Thermoprotei archaeon]
MAVLIFNVGFTAEYVMRVLARRSIQNVEKVYLVTIESQDSYAQKRSQEAINSIVSYLATVGVTDVEVIKVSPEWDFDEIVERISERVGGYDDYEFYLVGGTRMTLLSLYFIALILAQADGVRVKAVAFDEAMTNSKELPLRIPQIPSGEKLNLLLMIREGESVSELARKTGKSASTISIQLSDLEDEGLVVRSRDGKRKEVGLTPLGRTVLNLLGETGLVKAVQG